MTPIGCREVCTSVDSCLGHDMTPPPSRGIGVLVELAPLLGLAPIRLLLADVVLLLVPADGRPTCRFMSGT